MEKIPANIKKFYSNEGGATAIEYGLIAALIVIVIIASIALVGGDVQGLFESTEDDVTDVVNDALRKM